MVGHRQHDLERLADEVALAPEHAGCHGGDQHHPTPLVGDDHTVGERVDDALHVRGSGHVNHPGTLTYRAWPIHRGTGRPRWRG